MESEHESQTSNDVKTHQNLNLQESDHLSPQKMSASSSFSSTSSSSYEDTEDIDENETSSLGVEDTTPVPKHDKENPTSEEIPANSMRGCEPTSDGVEELSVTTEHPDRGIHESSSDNDSPKQCPPTQVMERADESTTPSSESTPYRLPSYVFARNKSTAPMEWSVASNESLFSIQMGNSFTNEYSSWMKSGELTEFSNIPLAVSKKTNDAEQHEEHNDQTTATKTKAAESTEKAIKQNDEGSSKGNRRAASDITGSPNLSHRSDESGASVKSFAFPVLSVESDRSGPLMGDTEKQKKQPQSPSQPETPKVTPVASQKEPSKPQTPKENQNGKATQTSWFSRFPCCTFCS